MSYPGRDKWLTDASDNFAECLELGNFGGAQTVIDDMKYYGFPTEELEKELQSARANHTEE